VTLPGGRVVLITDTVGFIQKLPTTLVAAFRATLEEITEADVLLHVVDITHENAQEQVATVLQVLTELDATGQPIVTALNKIDRLPHREELNLSAGGLAHSVAVSALTGEGLPELLAEIEGVLGEELVTVSLLLPYQRGDLLGLFHQRGVIDREEHGPAGTRLWGKLPSRLVPRFASYANLSKGG
jgi:GTP-binding protein HflX